MTRLFGFCMLPALKCNALWQNLFFSFSCILLLFSFECGILNTSFSTPFFPSHVSSDRISLYESVVQLRARAVYACLDHHHHQSLNHEGGWGTADDFATSFLHFPLFSTPEGRPGMSDVSPLSGISGLSFDSTLLSPLLFFFLVLLPFLSYRFLPAGPFFYTFSRKFFNIFR